MARLRKDECPLSLSGQFLDFDMGVAGMGIAEFDQQMRLGPRKVRSGIQLEQNLQRQGITSPLRDLHLQLATTGKSLDLVGGRDLVGQGKAVIGAEGSGVAGDGLGDDDHAEQD